MNKIFATYGATILLLFAAATHQGYTVSSLFAKSHHTGATENRYHK